MRPHLASLVEDFRRHAGDTAVVAHRGNRRYATSYSELASLAGRFSAELERRGVGVGDRVVLWGENSAEWIGVFFGCLLRGVIVVPLDAAGTPEFAARVIQDVTPKLIVGDAGLVDVLSSPLSVDRSATSSPNHETENGQRTTDNAMTLPLASILERLPAEPLYAVATGVTQQTPFQIVFTSGTTSEPRGIVHTHRNVLVTLDPIEREMAKYGRYERIVHPLRFLHSLPLSHVFGQFMGLWCPALLAAEVHFAPRLEPARLTELIRRERISVLVAVPRVLQLLRGHLVAQFPELERSPLSVDRSPRQAGGAPSSPDNAERTTNDGGIKAGLARIAKKWWRFRRVHRALGWKFWAVISGGATLPADLEAFWNQLGYALIQGYGMTETAALITLNHPFRIAPGTIGKPLPGREVKITGEGEILVRGDMLSGATWQGGAMRPREGEWLATGDLAERGAAGDLKFLGRKGDVIVTAAGMNIHPSDLEAALGAQAGVRAAVVVPCEFTAGPEPVAVVLTPLTGAGLDAAVAAANRTLAEVQQIRRVLRWPEVQFPYTSTGKLLRRRVAEWACAELAGNRGRGTGGPAADMLLAIVADVTGEPIPGVAEPNALRLSEDLHLDSLGRVQLQSALEQRLGVELEDDELGAAATVGDLRALVEGNVVRSTPTNHEEQTTVNTEPRPQPAAKNAERTPEHLYPHWPWSWPVRLLRIAFLELVMRPLVWLLAKPRVTSTLRAQAAFNERRGTENEPPLLIIANHITAYDGALILYALPFRLRRRVAVAMSGEMLVDLRRSRNQPNAVANLLAPAGYLLITALFNVFPLPRARGFRRSFAHTGEAMDRGYSVLLFPEGTRSRTGEMNPFRPGIGLLAQESGVPILPVALAGMYDDAAGASFSGSGARGSWFHSGQVEVHVGAPIPAAAGADDPGALTAQLEQAVRNLLDRREA